MRLSSSKATSCSRERGQQSIGQNGWRLKSAAMWLCGRSVAAGRCVALWTALIAFGAFTVNDSNASSNRNQSEAYFRPGMLDRLFLMQQAPRLDQTMVLNIVDGDVSIAGNE